MLSEQISSCLVIAEPEGSKKRLVAPTTKNLNFAKSGEKHLSFDETQTSSLLFSQKIKKEPILLSGDLREYEKVLFFGGKFCSRSNLQQFVS